MSEYSIQYGLETIPFSIVFADRKNMEISVMPNGSVEVKAPKGSSILEIQTRVTKRARWIRKKLDYFQQFTPKTTQRRHVGGETHLYLGRQYRLKIDVGEKDEIKLTRGFFWITCKKSTSSDRVRILMDRWYYEKACRQFNESLDRCLPSLRRLGVSRPNLQVRKMKYRWGSLSSRGALLLNTDLIRAPKECIDYVVTHELCHIVFRNHNPEFYALLERIMPDWERRKIKLELTLM
jgi:predicted metal-dependent hydrolase